MKLLSRSAGLIAVSLGLGAAAVAAQEPDRGSAFHWYVGGEAGILNYKTPQQTRGSDFTAGGHLLVMAHRTGLMLGVDEVFGSNNSSAYADATAPGGTRFVTFNHLRKYSATVAAFPVKPSSMLQPYIGLGFGILQTVNAVPSPNTAAAQDEATRRGSFGFGSATFGLQYNLSRFALFGQYQVTTAPSQTELLQGPTHTITGGLRINLGRARETLTGGGY